MSFKRDISLNCIEKESSDWINTTQYESYILLIVLVYKTMIFESTSSIIKSFSIALHWIRISHCYKDFFRTKSILKEPLKKNTAS